MTDDEELVQRRTREAKHLRTAAQHLRDAARNATPSADPFPGGWLGHGHVEGGLYRSALYGGPTVDGYRTGVIVEVAEGCDAGCVPMSEADTAYIGRIHPAVGLAVAALLDEAAGYAELQPHRGDWTLVNQALAIADEIMGVPAERALAEVSA